MSEAGRPGAGRVAWTDLTTAHADTVRDFYAAVVGWTASEVDMGGYADYTMIGADGSPVAGICHARGANATLPPVWLVYLTVNDLDASLSACRRLGGSVLEGPRAVGSQGRFAVVRDPAGAVAALYEDTTEP